MVEVLTNTFELLQVDFMLGSYMEDLGINSEQFEKIFGGKGKRETDSEIHTFLFEQVRYSCFC